MLSCLFKSQVLPHNSFPQSSV